MRGVVLPQRRFGIFLIKSQVAGIKKETPVNFVKLLRTFLLGHFRVTSGFCLTSKILFVLRNGGKHFSK